MKLYAEAKEIAKCVAKMRGFIKKLDDKGLEIEGIAWESARLVGLDKETIQHIKDKGGETEDYYVEQWAGYCEDDFSGTVYFKTDVHGQYVAVDFCTY